MYDVVIVGYGPTGMLAAILLGRAGHRVAVLERYTTLYNLPRVGIVHDDVLRMFQEVGIVDRVWPSTYFLPVYELANKGRVLLSSEVSPYATHGWPEYISIYQPDFERELDVLAKSLATVDVFQGRRVTGFVEDDDGVAVTAVEESGETHTLRGRYVIGADGGNSFVREALGVPYEDLGFDQDWLVIDGRERLPRPDLPAMRQLCEPDQPGVTLKMGPNHRRWSFMIFPGESPDEAVKEESVWRRLDRVEGATPDELELTRVAWYKFQSLYAEPWRVGRVFLAGDAAHQMPPFLAQGLCSGFRDAHVLAWKLDLVLRGVTGDAFLDTYEAERGPSARATIVESMRVGLHVNERDPEKVARRDAELAALQDQKRQSAGDPELIAFRVPGMTGGFVARDGGDRIVGAGDAFVQGRVAKNGRAGLFDDVAGRGFLIVSRDPVALEALVPEDRAFWDGIGGDIVIIGAEAGGLDDIHGRYTGLMDEYGCDVLVKRPDPYLFGACRTASDLPALIADIRYQLTSP